MSDLGEHYGVQVVKVKDDHTYKLDEAALKQILLREDVKDLPVVLVSVAGAFRGGKSFLLDLFIKYFNALESKRNGKDWFGDENEPLGGFLWRGGCDRETTGMYLWSDPIKVTYNGEKVAVLLMDTQGTFDSCSTVRDCSTIFALSTLLSSVQIYNLKENIKEDDLQNLHLFTEYGKLAQEQDTTPFQVLTFLVRDWPYPHQHSYGAVGGQQLLDKRLEITASHTEDMRNLRTSIRSFFKSVQAFLMPHPGFVVTEPGFDGRLANIRPEFKESLLELMLLIGGSENLTPKTINGQRIKCCDLFYYFQMYMEIFNSNVLPEPVTIMKATSDAALLAAAREARDAYGAVMEPVGGARAPCVPASALRRAHVLALQAAHDAFSAKRKMGPQKDIDQCLATIIEELEARLASYETLNDAKLKSAIANTHKAYEDTIQEMCGDQVLCLHPSDLDVLHLEAVTKATECFDSLRTSDGDEDDERYDILEKLEGKLRQLRNKNDQNNRGFVTKAHEHYVMYLANATNEGTFLSDQLLQQRHSEAEEGALNLFNSHRNMETCEPEDPYVEMLLKNIKDQHSKNKHINKNANRTAKQAAQHTYSDYMNSKWSSQVYCLHPNDLHKFHKEAIDVALEEFMSNRTTEGNEEDDVDRNNLIEILDKQYAELKDDNETSNDRAVDEAYKHYCNKMEKNCKPSLLTILIVPLIIKILKQFPDNHESAKREAIDVFHSRRRRFGSYNSDKYLDRLNNKLDQGYDDYCNPLKALAREFGVPI